MERVKKLIFVKCELSKEAINLLEKNNFKTMNLGSRYVNYETHMPSFFKMQDELYSEGFLLTQVWEEKYDLIQKPPCVRCGDSQDNPCISCIKPGKWYKTLA